MPSTTLVLARHAEAAGDEGDDPGLTLQGQRQAAALRDRLADWLDATSTIHHSSRRRATETAEIIADGRLGLTASEDLADRTPTPIDWSGVPTRDHGLLRSVPPGEQDPGGDRLDRALHALSRLGDDDHVAIGITHTFVIGWFVRAALDAPRWRWIGLNSAPTGLTIIRHDHDSGFRLVTFNDTGHL